MTKQLNNIFRINFCLRQEKINYNGYDLIKKVKNNFGYKHIFSSPDSIIFSNRKVYSKEYWLASRGNGPSKIVFSSFSDNYYALNTKTIVSESFLSKEYFKNKLNKCIEDLKAGSA